MRKTKEEAQITREKIIQASYELIGEKGYERMTRDDIAARVGMTRGAVNWHFSSKEEIYLAALDWILDEFQSERRACFEDKTARPEEKIERLISMPVKMREKYRFINAIPEYMLKDDRFLAVVQRMAENRKQFILHIEECLIEIEKLEGRLYDGRRERAHLLYFLHEGLHANYADSAFESREEIQNRYKDYLSFLLKL